jgi:hypothetical protein
MWRGPSRNQGFLALEVGFRPEPDHLATQNYEASALVMLHSVPVLDPGLDPGGKATPGLQAKITRPGI